MTKIKTAMPSQGSLPFTFPSTPVAMQQGLFLTFGTSCSGGIPAQADCADALWLIQVMVWMVQWVIYNNLGIMCYFQRSSRSANTTRSMWYNYIIFQCFRRRLLRRHSGVLGKNYLGASSMALGLPPILRHPQTDKPVGWIWNPAHGDTWRHWKRSVGSLLVCISVQMADVLRDSSRKQLFLDDLEVPPTCTWKGFC